MPSLTATETLLPLIISSPEPPLITAAPVPVVVIMSLPLFPSIVAAELPFISISTVSLPAPASTVAVEPFKSILISSLAEPVFTVTPPLATIKSIISEPAPVVTEALIPLISSHKLTSPPPVAVNVSILRALPTSPIFKSPKKAFASKVASVPPNGV